MDDLPRQKLQEIITQHGHAICDDPNRCETLLYEFCPQYKREISILMDALKEGIDTELLNTLNVLPVEVVAPKLVQRLYDHLGMAEEFAFWAVEVWAWALGLIQTPLQKPKKSTPIPSQKDKSISPPSSQQAQNKDTAQEEEPPPIQPKQKPVAAINVIRLRNKPQTIIKEDARKVFRLNADWRPVQYIEHVYERCGEVVFDHATGLMWQQSGSDIPLLMWQQSGSYVSISHPVQEYIERLNRQKFAGYIDWRLPTIPELMSLIEPTKKNGDLYIDPLFAQRQRWCWSADRYIKGVSSEESCWLVSFNHVYVHWHLLYNEDFVRCVRSF